MSAEPSPAPETPWSTGPDVEPTSDEPDGGQAPTTIDVESLLADLERVTAERDGHLQDLQRVSAEFANFRKQAGRRHQEIVEQAAVALVEKLLPVLDAGDAALAQGAADVAPIHANLLDILRKEGLETLAESGEAFDPNRHEAVMHEPGEGDTPIVVEVLRSGYVWNGRTIRPAMVKVRG